MTALAAWRADPIALERLKYGLFALVVTGTAFAAGVLFSGNAVLAMLLSLALIAGLAIFARPDAATYILVAVLYSNAAAIAVQFHGLPYIAGLVFPAVLALPLGNELLLKRRRVTITAGLPYLFGYMLVMLVSAAAAQDTSAALDHLAVFLVGGFGIYFVVTNVIRTWEVLRRVIWTVLLVAAGVGALTTYQMVTNTYGNSYYGFAQVNLPGRGTTVFTASLQGVPRSRGPVGEINRYGQLMVVLLPVGAMMALYERRRALQLLAIGATILILFGMATSFSRGAALGLAAMLLPAVLLGYVRPVHLLLLAVALAITMTAFPRYGERLADLEALGGLDRATAGTVQGDAGNLRSRVTQTLAALYVFTDHPLIGVGRGQFPQYYQQYAREVAASGVDTRIEQSTRAAHNLYTSMAAETGLLGFTAFMAIFAVTMRDLLRARRRWLKERPAMAHLATGFFLALVGYLVSGIGLHLSYERYLWFLLALAAITAHLALKGEDGGGSSTVLGTPPSPDQATAAAAAPTRSASSGRAEALA